jgi:polyisoprenoid-binding protein YceI
MNKILGTAIIIAVVLFAGYLYATRPLSKPTEDVQNVTNTLKPLSNITSVYRISKEGSKVEFQMNELLNGKPKLVVGTTTQIAGDIAITNSHVDFGEIKIDARTLETDSSQRNAALNRFILKTGTAGNEYITFKQISNDFKGTIKEGEEAAFTATGDLTISGVTKIQRFTITMKLSGDTLTGRAQIKIKRSDFGLSIPNLSFIANVDDEFPVTIDITAKKVSS